MADTDPYLPRSEDKRELDYWRLGRQKVESERHEIATALPTIVRTSSVFLSNERIKNLAANPMQLVPPPGVPYLIEMISAVLILFYGSEVLAEPSAPDNLAIEYDDGTGTQIATWDTTGFITNNADAMEIVHGASIGGGASAIALETNWGKNVVLINTGGEYTGNASNDTTMKVMFNYILQTTAVT